MTAAREAAVERPNGRSTTACPGRGDRRGPHPAAVPRRHRGHPAHQRLRRRRPARRSPSSSTAPGAGPAGAACRGARSGSIRRGVEGIHLRGGPVARGGLRWSDRRDDFRTEILGLMKAQLVKNAVIVPTGAKGGFYPKQLPPPSRPRRLAGRGHRKLPDLHPRPAVGHRQYRRRQGRPSRRRRRSATATIPISSSPPTRAPRPSPTSPTRSRVERGLLARRRLRQRRQPRLRPQGDGHHRPRRLGLGPAPLPPKWASTCRRSRSGSSASATCRATCSATACCCRRRSSWSPPSTTATSSSIPIPIRRRAGRSATGCSTCRARAGTITTRKLISKGGGVFPRSQKSIPLSPRDARAARHRGRGDRSGRR